MLSWRNAATSGTIDIRGAAHHESPSVRSDQRNLESRFELCGFFELRRALQREGHADGVLLTGQRRPGRNVYVVRPYWTE